MNECSTNVFVSFQRKCKRSKFFRVKDFEETLNGYNKEVEAFKKKEVASPDEMQRNVEKLAELDKLLKEAAEELEVVMLEKLFNDETLFSQNQSMILKNY